MAKLSLSPKFIKEVFLLFREKSLKDVFFGKKATLSSSEKQLASWIKEHPDEFKRLGGRRGSFVKIDPIHKGEGMVYVLPDIVGDKTKSSRVLLSESTKVTNGPDLWVYLSTSKDIKKEGLGAYLNLGLMKGNKGGQSYVVEKPIAELVPYNSVVIWCKQFSVLFTVATLL
jgi:hypothetical protein